MKHDNGLFGETSSLRRLRDYVALRHVSEDSMKYFVEVADSMLEMLPQKASGGLRAG
jgi:hypothetical protein